MEGLLNPFFYFNAYINNVLKLAILNIIIRNWPPAQGLCRYNLPQNDPAERYELAQQFRQIGFSHLYFLIGDAFSNLLRFILKRNEICIIGSFICLFNLFKAFNGRRNQISGI